MSDADETHKLISLRCGWRFLFFYLFESSLFCCEAMIKGVPAARGPKKESQKSRGGRPKYPTERKKNLGVHFRKNHYPSLRSGEGGKRRFGEGRKMSRSPPTFSSFALLPTLSTAVAASTAAVSTVASSIHVQISTKRTQISDTHSYHCSERKTAQPRYEPLSEGQLFLAQ